MENGKIVYEYNDEIPADKWKQYVADSDDAEENKRIMKKILW